MAASFGTLSDLEALCQVYVRIPLTTLFIFYLACASVSLGIAII